MAGRSPGRLTANPPETSSTSVMVSRRKAGVGGDEVAGELAEQEAGLPQRRRDHHGKTALQHGPGRFERGHCALAALSRRIEEQSRRRGEQHIALPGIERQPGDALGPSDGIVERGGLSRCQSCERAAEQGQLALEGGGAHARASLARAPSHRRRP